MNTVLYPGTFDPLTHGHLDIIRRAARLFDHVIVAVSQDQPKEHVFSVEQRLDHLHRTCGEIPTVSITSFPGLLNQAVRELGAVAIVRGLRAVSDFEWEFQMALMSRELSAECETVFLMSSPRHSFVSSTMIREIARLNGSVAPFVPARVAQDLHRAFHGDDG